MAAPSRTAQLNLIAVVAGLWAFGCMVAFDAWYRNRGVVTYVPEWFPVNGMLLYAQVHSVGFQLVPAFVVGLLAATRPILLGAMVAGTLNPLNTVLTRGGGHAVWLLLSGQDLTPSQHQAAVEITRAFLVANMQAFATAAVFGAAAAALGWYVRSESRSSPRDKREEP